MNKYKKTRFTVSGIKDVEWAAWGYFTSSHKEGSTQNYAHYGQLSELLQPEELGFEDPLNDDLSLLLCSTDVLW